MELYHFTSAGFLPLIQKDGITTGDVPLVWNKRGTMKAMWRRVFGNRPLSEAAVFKPRAGSYGFGLCAPWLTSDPTWQRQDWSKTPHDYTNKDMVRAFGEKAHGAKFTEIDKSAVRLTVEIPDSEMREKLYHWPEFAVACQVADWWYDSLDRAGGGGSGNWWIYNGVIVPSRIVKVEFRPGTGNKTNGAGDSLSAATKETE